MTKTNLLMFVLGFLVAYDIFVASSVLQVTPTTTTTTSTTTITLPEVSSATANVVAVNSRDRIGVIGKATVELRPGKGRVLMNTNPFVEPDTQYSFETAVKVAEKTTKVDLSDKDVILSFDIPSKVVGGPSAGGAITAATIAAVEGKKVRKDVVMTGTIEPDGSIGEISGVLEKATAAGESNLSLFLVPEGQSLLTYYEKKVEERRIGSFVFTRVYYVPKTLDLNNYTMDNWDLEVKEVSKIDEALPYLLD